jgi:hypothetical protein
VLRWTNVRRGPNDFEKIGFVGAGGKLPVAYVNENQGET